MTERFEYDVFISHSVKDKHAVRKLAERLKADGLHVWLDEWVIEPDDIIEFKVDQGLKQSRTLIMAMSTNSFASEWVTLERHALLFRDPTNAQRRFIPLRLDNAEIRDPLRPFAYIDWREESDAEYALLLALCRPVESESPQDPTAAEGNERTTHLGHASKIFSVALSSDGRLALSGSEDTTLRVWDVERGHCLATLEGHTKSVLGVAISGNDRLALSGSEDTTLRVWDFDSGRCLSILSGHHKSVFSVSLNHDGHQALSGSGDGVVRIWSLKEIALVTAQQGARYTNAKVVLVGESGVGKTGLAIRLCEDRWEATESTHGMLVSQLKLTDVMKPANIDREIWLWDFAGQADYRLIHQLYMDETALGLLVFDPQDDNPFEDISYWEEALRTATRARGIKPAKLLVAARCDRGSITVSKKRFDQFCQKHNFAGLWLTGAKTGDGCRELKAAIAEHIPWDRLPYTSTTRLFKSLKDALLKLKEQEMPLIRLSELRQRLQLMMPSEIISAEELHAVVGLMQGQGGDCWAGR